MLSGVTRYARGGIYGGVNVGGDRGWTVAGAARFEAEVFGTKESLEHRESGGSPEQHGLRWRALIYLKELECEDTCRHLGRGQILTTTVNVQDVHVMIPISWYLST